MSPTELEPGDIVPWAGTVVKVRLMDDPRWVAHVTWDDGGYTLYGPRARVQRIKGNQ